MTHTAVAGAAAGRGTELPVVPHWIDGAEYPSASGRTAPVYDPALGTETKRVALANQVEVDAAVASAKAAFPRWRELSLARRQGILFKFRDHHLRARQGAV
jgi:malonate-semialdehyde dehydrogenase (acetylating)/methylmalonate-semialdehyde dehydrogenase